MYVSYPVGLMFAGIAFGISYFLVEASRMNIFLSIMITMIIFMPIVMRLSRNIWINFLMKYDAEKSKES
jgi:hypothetical protein